MSIVDHTLNAPTSFVEACGPLQKRQDERRCDALVIGGGLKGILTTYILSNAGYQTMLIEKAPQLGGLMGSFTNANGRSFDYGYHALDRNRSEFATRFVEAMLGGNVRTYRLNRAIVLRSELIPYNAPIDAWPDSLRRGAESCHAVDRKLPHPTRDDLYPIYGPFLTDLVFDEALRSYPALRWRLDAGCSEQALTDLIYPWFFPRAAQPVRRDAEWQQYHDAVRERGMQEVIYPAQGGQAALPAAIVSRFRQEYTDIRAGCGHCEFEVSPVEQRIVSVRLGDDVISTDRVFWCGSTAQLCRLFGIALSSGVPQRLILGSFEFSSPIQCPYHETLVGDPEHLINRISLPGKVGGTTDNLVQVEYAAPVGELQFSDDEWRERWLASLHRLGVVDRNNAPVDVDVRSLPWGMTTVEDLSTVVERWRQALTHPESNVVYPFLGAGPESTSRLVPEVFRNVVACITR